MRRTYRARPSKAASAIAAIMSIVMLVLGLSMMNGGFDSQPRMPPEMRVSLPNDFGSSHSSHPTAPKPFQAVWVIVCILGF